MNINGMNGKQIVSTALAAGRIVPDAEKVILTSLAVNRIGFDRVLDTYAQDEDCREAILRAVLRFEARQEEKREQDAELARKSAMPSASENMRVRVLNIVRAHPSGRCTFAFMRGGLGITDATEDEFKRAVYAEAKEGNIVHNGGRGKLSTYLLGPGALAAK